MDEREAFLREEISRLLPIATGRTTRMADWYIQKLYENEGEWIEVYDHFGTDEADKALFDKIVARLAAEHPHDEIETDSTRLMARVAYSRRDDVEEKIGVLLAELQSMKSTEPYDPIHRKKSGFELN